MKLREKIFLIYCMSILSIEPFDFLPNTGDEGTELCCVLCLFIPYVSFMCTGVYTEV